MITLTELACKLNVSVFTIERWYRWQRRNDLKVLPIPQRIGRANYWQDSDIPILMEFKNNIIKGRNGEMTNGKSQNIKQHRRKTE